MKQSTGTQTIEAERLLDAEQVAKLFGKQVSTIKRWAREKRLPAIKIGGSWQFNEAEILRVARGKPFWSWREWGDSLC